MSITKDSKEWLAARALVPPTKEDLGPDCHIAHPGTRCPDRRPPDISPDLLYAIRRAIEARGYQWILKFSPEFGYIFFIYRHDGEQVSNSQYAETEDEVIIRAAASLVAALAVKRD